MSFFKKLFLVFVVTFFGCQLMPSEGKNYTIFQLDLSKKPADLPEKYNSLYDFLVVDDGSESNSSYMAHPDSVLLSDNSILTLYPLGHGMGKIIGKKSFDNGATWGTRLTSLPEDWATSKETPTIYRLGDLSDNTDPWRNYLVMISANPSWSGTKGDIYGNGRFNGNGFNVSLSKDDGATWSKFENFYPYGSDGYVDAIVAMASLTRLKKEDKSWDDKWMGLFHDKNYVNYKSILTIDENGKMNWSKPEKYMKDYRCIEAAAGMCEVETIRSEKGKGDILLLLARSNKKKNNSLITISYDEGKTWSKPFEAPSAINGERHKADWLDDGRLFITFRSIERDKEKIKKYSSTSAKAWFSEGWVAWVGTFDDLVNGKEGEYRIKLAHTYLKGQDSPEVEANADTGYCGNVVLPNGNVVTSSYGCFQSADKTIIVSKTIDISLLDELVALQKSK